MTTYIEVSTPVVSGAKMAAWLEDHDFRCELFATQKMENNYRPGVVFFNTVFEITAFVDLTNRQSSGMKTLWRFHESDAQTAMLFKLTWGGQ